MGRKCCFCKIKRCGRRRCCRRHFDARWFNRRCCNFKRSMDEVYNLLNPK
ncbi:MAG: hypothetical protein SOV90_07890 [Lachnospiraceae bacterium]|nr:hypothetical protein [Clostridiales bacterium]MDD6292413.1 hypothetical protein [Eubacteriales bacterium]MDY2607823.1 hypothetical protein [Lachnospiraceae bacterium]